MSHKVTVYDDGHRSIQYTVTINRAPFLPLEQRQEPYNIPHTRWLKNGVEPGTDWMRKRSYEAERQLCKSNQIRWEEFRPAADYLGTLMSTAWFQRRWPNFHELRLTYLRGSRGAWANSVLTASTGVLIGRIQMSRWAIGAKDVPWKTKMGGEAMLLHEFAHALCPKEHWHSPLWSRTYLDLIGFRMGSLAYQTLKDGFDNCGVRYRPYRLISPEQRVQLVERMRVVRAQRTPCTTNNSQGSKTC